MIDHLHGRHAMPENIGPVRRLWMMTLLGEPPAPAASTTSTYVCSSAAKRLSTRRAAATTSPMQPSKTPGNQLFCDGARYKRVAVRFVLM